MSEHPDIKLHERLAAYTLGSMDPDERREFERELRGHLAEGCPQCEQALQEYSDAVVLLAETAPAASPSDGLRDRVLAAVADETPAPAEPAAAPAGSALLRWAAILIVGILGAGGWIKFFEARRALERKDVDLVRLTDRLDRVTRQLEESGRVDALMVAAQRLEFVPLETTDAGTAAPIARVAYDASASRAVAVLDEATPPTGRDFQLWALADGSVQSLGVVRADESGRAVLEADVLATATDVQGFAVSLEPEGGSPDPNAPSGPVVSVGLRGDA